MVRQIRALPARFSDFCRNVMQTLAVEESKLRREELLREIANQKPPE
ncbi:MAG TPA: hypothetical protein VGD60_07915 [Candidatus Acidoferrales bacterium]